MAKRMTKRPYTTFALDILFVGVAALGLVCMAVKIYSGSENNILAHASLVMLCWLSAGYWFQSKQRMKWLGKTADKSKYESILKEYKRR